MAGRKENFRERLKEEKEKKTKKPRVPEPYPCTSCYGFNPMCLDCDGTGEIYK